MKRIVCALMMASMTWVAAAEEAAPLPAEARLAPHWKGACVAFLGDSITDPIHVGTKRNYWQDVGDWLGLDYTSFGQNGCQFPAIAGQADRAAAKYGDKLDALFIFCGTNDYNGSVPMGEWFVFDEEEVNRDGRQTKLRRRSFSFDGGTFRGRINAVMKHLKERFPRQQIVLMTPIHRGFAQFSENNVQPPECYANARGLFIDDYAAAVREAGAIWSVPVIDLFAESGLQPLVESNLAFFANAQRDQLHPNTQGHNRIARTMIAKMNAMPVNFK